MKRTKSVNFVKNNLEEEMILNNTLKIIIQELQILNILTQIVGMDWCLRMI